MRLVILLGYPLKKFELCKDDILLTRVFAEYEKEGRKRKAYFVNDSLANLDEDLPNIIASLFQAYPEEFQIFQNRYYRSILSPIMSILMQINSIIDETGVKQIVLLGGSGYPFCTMRRGEGEGKPIWYKSAWLMNPIIAEYFKGRAEIIWLNKKHINYYKAFNSFRFWCMMLAISAIRIGKSIKHKRYELPIKLDPDKVPAILIGHKPLQFESLHMMLEPVVEGKIEIFTFTPFGLEGSFSWNYSISPILKAAAKAIRLRSRISKDTVGNIDTKGIPLGLLPSQGIANSLAFEYFLFSGEYECMLKRLKGSGFPPKTRVITDMTLGADVQLCYKLASELGWCHFNIPHMPMDIMSYPTVELADYYFLYTKSTYDYFISKSKNYWYHFPIFKEPDPVNRPWKSSPLRVTIFTQPDRFADQFLWFLNKIDSDLRKRGDINVAIKLHHRQNKTNDFITLAQKNPYITLISSGCSAPQAIYDSDLCISICSSILAESVLHGKMGAIINIPGKTSYRAEYDDLMFSQINFTVSAINDFWDIINRYDDYWDLFLGRYRDYVESLKGNQSLMDVLLNLP